jgi:uncharacterized protein YutE (UPF0331/DUF86 family)
MVSIEKIAHKFELVDGYLGLLREISKTSKMSFLENKILIGSAKYYLQVSIECCLDVANHVIASERLRSPKDYADSFKVLVDGGVVSNKLGLRLRQMAKFRNRLVHLYGEIDDASVYKYITEDLKDIVLFKTRILKKYGGEQIP